MAAFDKVGKEYTDKETGIWAFHDRILKRHRCDFLLAGAIGVMFRKVKSVADVGCGNGQYCAIMKAFGKPVVHGYEGTPGIKSLGIYNDIMTVDLTKRRYVGIYYDLVLCLEVGEHIPPKHEQVFIDNLCEYVSKFLVISWAPPGQGGTGHYNEKSNVEVITELMARGLVLEEKHTALLRTRTTLPWFKNVMVFRNGN